MPEGENVVAEVGSGLNRKLGPLPIWGWALGIVGVGGVVYLVFLKPKGGSSSALPSGILGGGTPPTGGLGGGGGDGGGSSGTSPAVNTLTNAQWLQNVISQTATATGLPIAQVQMYLNEWLNGEGPIGSQTATSAFNQVIQAALNAGGQPPAPPSSTSSINYFTSNQAWLASILEFLPSGTSGSVQTELTNLVNGTTTTISQAAADALASAEGIVGQSPQLLSYTVGTGGGNGNGNGQYQVPVLSAVQQFINNWTNQSDFSQLNYESMFQQAFNLPQAAADQVRAWSEQYKQNTGNAPSANLQLQFIQDWINGVTPAIPGPTGKTANGKVH